MEKLADEQDQPTENVANDKRETRETHEPVEGFNWMLPLLGAVGFGVGFALSRAIGSTIFDVVKNAVYDVNSAYRPGLDVAITRGVVAGGLGGVALGLAFRDKKYALHFAVSGAIGFAAAFALVICILYDAVAEIGRALMGGYRSFMYEEVAGPHGVGMGAIIGAIGGLILGLASPKGRIVASLLLSFTGAIWFSMAFGFGFAASSGYRWWSWNGWGGAVGGAVLGLTLAVFYWIRGRLLSGSAAELLA